MAGTSGGVSGGMPLRENVEIGLSTDAIFCESAPDLTTYDRNDHSFPIV